MAVKLKSLSGSELVSIFEHFGFAVVSQNGSHVKMRRMSTAGSEMIIIPAHNRIPKGTLRAIFNQAAHFVPRDELFSHFYTTERQLSGSQFSAFEETGCPRNAQLD
jgi:predicted RNA binding protein YcfA (HicA-like mRNA interferase family)